MTSQLILEDPFVTVRSISVSDMDNNVFVITGKADGMQIIIDAADNTSEIIKLTETALTQDFQGQGDPVGVMAVYTTHSHWDHIRALPAVLEETGADAYAGAEDVAAIGEQEHVEVIEVEDDEAFIYNSFVLTTIHLMGHTPGSIAYVLTTEDDGHPAHIFTGDSLFPGGVGKTNSPEDFESLINDVEAKLFNVYEDETLIHPGHGKSTTLGAERDSLPEWRERGW